MWKKYYQYIPWLIVGLITSYSTADYYARDQFDLLYLSVVFMIVYISLLVLHEKVLKEKYKDFFIHLFSNSPKDSQK
ncbi:hypothetical protein STRDD10_01001 [Streptococcus sp. DD10]|nr:hypothetical protein [Streptococcus sp. DD10]KXT74340.1 hypothetical protein STRDD10_01001 [Streptococcus sp. DD10]